MTEFQKAVSELAAAGLNVTLSPQTKVKYRYFLWDSSDECTLEEVLKHVPEPAQAMLCLGFLRKYSNIPFDECEAGVEIFIDKKDVAR